MKLVSKSFSGVACKEADVKNGIHSVINIIHPDGIIDTHASLFVGRHSAVSTVGRTNAKVIVVFPCGIGAGTDIGICTFVFGTHHSFSEAGGAISPVARLAAVTDGEEVLVSIGQIFNIADSKARASPAGLAAVRRIVGKADTRTQRSVAVGVGAVAEFIHVIESMFGIVVIVGSVPNGGTTYGNAPTVVFTSNEKDIVQITWIGHGVLFIFHAFAKYRLHLGHGFS